MPRKGWSALESLKWLVPGDPRSQATFSLLAQCKVVCARDEAAVHSAGGVRSNPGPPPRRCASAKKRVCGLEVVISAMIVNGFDETSFRGDFAEGF